MNVLLVSTYELGRQPFGLASPAAWLRRAGLDVECADVSREPLDEGAVERAGLVAFYLPMHTATRLALPLLSRVRRVNPTCHLCCYGLYAPLNERVLREAGAETILGPEFEEELTRLAQQLASPSGALDSHAAAEVPPPLPRLALLPAPLPGTAFIPPPLPRPALLPPPPPRLAFIPPPLPRLASLPAPLPRLAFITPDRSGLPPLSQYAPLVAGGERRTAGYTEASRGCKHRCRHCPIVPVYGGQFRVVPRDTVLADVRSQVALGARHITFGDPDFFNGVGHALPLVEAFAREFPGITYDVTIKVEHLLRHADLLPRLVATGCLFVTTAAEAVDDRILQQLAKGHTRAGFERAAALCRDAHLLLVPTFVAFTPWTTLDGYLEMLDEIVRLDLVAVVAPIQLALRLLIPSGSRLLELDEIRAVAGAFEPATLTYPWAHPDPRVDALQDEVMRVVATRTSASREAVFEAVSAIARRRAGAAPATPPRTKARREAATVPYLEEPWYC